MNKVSTKTLQKQCADAGRWIRGMFWLILVLVIGRLAYGCWLMFQPVEVIMRTCSLTAETMNGAGWQQGARLIGIIAFWWHSLFGILLLGIAWYWNRCFREINQKGSPFVPQCVRAIRATGIWVIVLGLLRGGLLGQIYQAAGFTFEQQIALTQDGLSFAISLAGQNSLVNWQYLTIGGIIIFLSYVFAYGAYLQQEYDETL